MVEAGTDGEMRWRDEFVIEHVCSLVLVICHCDVSLSYEKVQSNERCLFPRWAKIYEQ